MDIWGNKIPKEVLDGAVVQFARKIVRLPCEMALTQLKRLKINFRIDGITYDFVPGQGDEEEEGEGNADEA